MARVSRPWFGIDPEISDSRLCRDDGRDAHPTPFTIPPFKTDATALLYDPIDCPRASECA